jgi:dihydropteroate synthase
MEWHCREKVISTAGRTRVMGILNVTPDSFSDGGSYVKSKPAVAHARSMLEQGADIIDIGGESTRPGSQRVTVQEELQRVMPVIEALLREGDCLVSIDTMKAEVARAALEAGVHIINDVSALTADPEMLNVAKAYGAGVVLMHMQGEPRYMQHAPVYRDVVAEVSAFLASRVSECAAAGISRQALVIDPGIGFGKTTAHNLALLRGIPVLSRIGCPVLTGLSRKRFLGELTGRPVGARLSASLAAAAYAVMRGVHILRVHDVKETCDAVQVIDILSNEERRGVDRA